MAGWTLLSLLKLMSWANSTGSEPEDGGPSLRLMTPPYINSDAKQDATHKKRRRSA